MEKVAAIGDSRQLFNLIKRTGIENLAASEATSGKDGTIIHFQSRR